MYPAIVSLVPGHGTRFVINDTRNNVCCCRCCLLRPAAPPPPPSFLGARFSSRSNEGTAVSYLGTGSTGHVHPCVAPLRAWMARRLLRGCNERFARRLGGLFLDTECTSRVTLGQEGFFLSPCARRVRVKVFLGAWTEGNRRCSVGFPRAFEFLQRELRAMGILGWHSLWGGGGARMRGNERLPAYLSCVYS